MASERVPRRVIDGHSHIGELPAWRFYDLKEPVRPTVYDFSSTAEFTGHLDRLGVERALVIPNYGVPVHETQVGRSASSASGAKPAQAFDTSVSCFQLVSSSSG